MKKFIPSIIIYKLKIADKKTMLTYQNVYFLSYKMARRFWRKHKEELKNYYVSIGGEQLWLW